MSMANNVYSYRAIEYNTEDQPWDPMSAVTSALVGDLGTMAMAAADFPREIFEKRKSKTQAADGSAGGDAQAENASLGSSGSASVPSLLLSKDKGPATPDTSTETPSRTSTGESGATASQQTSLADTKSSTGRNLSPGPGRLPGSPSGRPASRGDASPSSAGPNPFTLETAIDASENVSRIVGTGMKMPMNVCMGLARGFRNAPKLYNDDTVRPMEKVTGFASGLRVASKEFGLGFYDGVSGLVTQPLKGAEKEGGRGLLKGFGKGIGGLILKPAAAIWSIPAYAMQGVHAEVRNIFARSSINYIVTSRVVQGKEDLATSTTEEQRDILERWQRTGDDLKGFYTLKQKEKAGLQTDGDGDRGGSSTTLAGEPPKTGWLHTRNLSFEDRRRLHKDKEVWKQQQQQQQQQPPPPPPQIGVPSVGTSSSGLSASVEDEEFERAIRASVKQTSRGDKAEDAQVEAAIRASLKEMRRIAGEQSREAKPEKPQAVSAPTFAPPPGDDDLTNITDEEYQALIEEAVQRSLAAERDAEPQATKATMTTPQIPDDDDDEQLRRAMEESQRQYEQELQKHKTEEDILLEHLKKQSLAEEEYSKSRGRGKAVADEDSIDEDLRRAMEESLKDSGRGGGGGPSSS